MNRHKDNFIRLLFLCEKENYTLRKIGRNVKTSEYSQQGGFCCADVWGVLEAVIFDEAEKKSPIIYQHINEVQLF
jgi:hypothetical protein